MNQRCVFCQSPLSPGERQCQQCGRWQPLSPLRYQPPDEPLDNTWEYEDPDWSAPGSPTEPRTFRRGALPGPSAHPGRPLRQPSTLRQPPFRRTAPAVKILVIALVVAVVELGGGALAVVLAQGGSTSQGRQAVIPGSATPTGAPTAETGTPTTGTPTTTPSTTTPTPTATPTRAQLCAPHSAPPLTYRIGPTYSTSYQLIPDDLPLQPLTLDQTPQGAGIVIGNTIDVAAIINLPPAGKTITICKMTLTLIAFTPLAGPVVNIWNDCESVWYNPGGLKDAPCDSTIPADGEASFTIATPEVGASMTSTVHNPRKNNSPGLVSEGSEGLGLIEGHVQVTVSGTYTFSVGLWQDDASGPTVGSKMVKVLDLIGQPSHIWGGKQCEAPDMQAQLPAPTDPPGTFICPGPPSDV